MNFRSVFPLILIVLVNSCHPLYCNWNSGYEQLTELTPTDVVVGTYALTQTSVDYLSSEGNFETCSLQLLESGEFKLVNAPYFMMRSTNPNTRTSRNRNGKWFSSCSESYDCVIELEGITVVPLSRKKDGPLAIPITIGDGDECNGIIFERTK